MRVKINVGGKIFETTSDTLQPSEYFRNLLERWDNNDEIFIDRDPRAFRSILNWLRGSGDLDEEHLPELEFYGIDLDVSNKITKYNLDSYTFIPNVTYWCAIVADFEKKYDFTSSEPNLSSYPLTTVMDSDEQFNFEINKTHIDYINDIRLITDVDVEIASAELWNHNGYIAKYMDLKTVDGECQLPFLKCGFLIPGITPHAKYYIKINYIAPPGNAKLIVSGGIYKDHNEAFRVRCTTLVTSRYILKGIGNKSLLNESFRRPCKTGDIKVTAWNGDTVVPVDFLKIYHQGTPLFMIRPEDFRIMMVHRLDNPEIELVSRFSIEHFEMLIEIHEPCRIGDGMWGKIYA